MNCIVPFESTQKFDYLVKEICSISLEHEFTVNDTDILGNFFVTGTLRKHELSVNTLDFKFVVPFSLAIGTNIKKDTLTLDIDNFTYELDGDKLFLKIDYVLNADDAEAEEEIIIPDVRENEIYDLIEDTVIEQPEMPEVETNYDNFFSLEDDYMTYQIYSVCEGDTIEGICLKYNISKDILLKVNKIDTLKVHDKLIIPDFS